MLQKAIRTKTVLLIQMLHKKTSIHGTLQKVQFRKIISKIRKHGDFLIYAKCPLKYAVTQTV